MELVVTTFFVDWQDGMLFLEVKVMTHWRGGVGAMRFMVTLVTMS